MRSRLRRRGEGPDGWTEPRRLSALLDAPADLLATYPSPIELTFEVDALTASVRDDALSTSRAVALMELTRTFLVRPRAPSHGHRRRLRRLRSSRAAGLTLRVRSPGWMKADDRDPL